MNLEDLKKKKPPELLAFAEEQGVELLPRTPLEKKMRYRAQRHGSVNQGYFPIKETSDIHPDLVEGWVCCRRAFAFDMRVVAYRRRPLPPELDGIEMCPTLPELLAQSDHVVVAAPATPETHHLIDADALAAIKPGAHLVNVARGTLVDQHALLEALDDGRVARASLDTVDPEPLPAGHALYAHPRVFVTAHISYAGQPLASRTRCYWKVMVWDRDGAPGPWSDTAHWEVGLLSPDDWHARWNDQQRSVFERGACLRRERREQQLWRVAGGERGRLCLPGCQ